MSDISYELKKLAKEIEDDRAKRYEAANEQRAIANALEAVQWKVEALLGQITDKKG